MNRKILIPLLAAACFSLCCAKKEPPLPENQAEQFARVYLGYLTICMSDTVRADQRAVYLQAELDRQKMSRTEFDRIRRQLEADPKAFITLLNRIEAALEALPAGTPPDPASPSQGTARPRTP